MPESEVIKSKDNAKLKIARAVRDGRESDLIFIEGVRLVREAVRSGVNFELVLVSEDLDASEVIPDLARTQVDSRLFDSIADTKTSQGIIAIARRRIVALDSIPDGLLILLHQVNNPSNLGAVIRTAEAAGVAGLITTTDSADAFSPKALRASMGSAFRLPIVQGIGFKDAIGFAKERGLTTTAADLSGTSSYTDIDWNIPRTLVFGSEAHGLDEQELAMIDEKIVIPMKNEVESLNLAVSSGIILFEAKRQRDLA